MKSLLKKGNFRVYIEKKQRTWKGLIVIMLAFSMFFCSACGKNQASEDNIRTYYQVFVYSFCDSDGDGIGDLNGVTSKLDYIEDLGFNGIWLSPIHPAATYHKYDVIDYMAVDEQYGSMEDLEKLLKECEKRHIKVLMDLVLNHTSAQNQWFVEAADYLKSLDKSEEPDAGECPYVDYYHFTRDGANQSGFEHLAGTDYYYEARFWDQMPDLNLENKKVREELEKVISYYLELGAGGFRLDAVKEYETDSTAESVEILAWVTEYCKGVKEDAYLVGEVWDSKEKIMEYYESGVDSLFNFPFGQSDGAIVKMIRKESDGESGKNFAQKEVNYQADINAVSEKLEKEEAQTNADFLSNHDVGRISGFMAKNEEQMKFAAGVNLMISGNAFVYYGEELGMSGSVKGAPGKDENKRAPMYWCEQDDAEGMTVGPPEMDEVVHRYGPLELQKEEAHSIYNYYKAVLYLRNTYPAISHGTESVLEAVGDGDIIALDKLYQDRHVWVLMNNSKDAKSVDLSDSDIEGLKMKGSAAVSDEEATFKNGELELPGYGIVIFEKK